ncbi:hypothetical protein CWI84_00090 [Idiomarina tyrosinivorans]|uniref:DUF4382 domain-containing protein n=2 Tax=Idiomarina tyrosinivorans TaxID=1445662 RepID=A0A432ZUF7_9GAMM|nr:hypothetical protein CWI84_00090 [Idiomarina tyrosinivorans]
MLRNLTYTAACLGAATLLTACGGGDENSSVERTAQFNLAVSDAPVSDLDAVVACFSAVELMTDGGPVQFDVGVGADIEPNDVCTDDQGNPVENTRGINLLEFTGSDSTDLLAGAEIDAGDYSQLRLVMDSASYVGRDTDDDGTIDETFALTVPSNELKLDGFTADAGGNLFYTVEFDLRSSLVNPVGQDGYFLKPRGVRLVNNAEVGTVSGNVAETILINNQCTVAPEDTSTPVANVYLYQGADLGLDSLADMGGAEENAPYASTSVYFDGVDSYDYEIGFVATGDYTVAITCDDEADPEADDDVTFLQAQNATVSNEATVTVDFSAQAQ